MFSITAVRALVRDFADLAGYEGLLILTTFDKARFNRACKRYRLRPVGDDSFGEAIVGVPIAMVWLDRAANRSAWRMTHTAAHEALHIAQPDLDHGTTFDGGVRRMLRGLEP